MKKIGFIIGAGASKAINPQIPVMNDFFSVADKFAQSDNNIKTTMDSLRKRGLIKGNSLGNANLEDVLQATTTLPRNQKNPWERPYDGLLLTIHKIFCILDIKCSPKVYIDMFGPVKDILDSNTMFISFNYDVFLERALSELVGWRADKGYGGKPLIGFIDSSQADSAQDESSICDEVYAWEIEKYPPWKPKTNFSLDSINIPFVFKPHGSLNWFTHSSKDPYMWIPNCKGLLLMGKNKENPEISQFWSYGTVNTVEGEFEEQNVRVEGILPAILPPGRKFVEKIKAPVFKNIYTRIIETLSEMSILIVIGWSMTGFDEHYRELFNKVRKMRKQRKLEKFIVCDIQNEDTFYERIRNLIPYKQFLVCKKGFGSGEFAYFIEDAIK